MPFRSEAQRRYLYAQHPDVARRFAAHTPTGTRLPERAKVVAHLRKRMTKHRPSRRESDSDFD